MNLSPHSTPEKPFGDGYGGTYSFTLGDDFDSAAAAEEHARGTLFLFLSCGS